MKSEIELARARQHRTAELAAGARYANERLALYRARSYGPKLTSPARLRELERAAALADARLRLAQAAPDTRPPAAEEDSEPSFRGETDEGVEFG
jgi:hypothetical protein